jgi:hypothetical protein
MLMRSLRSHRWGGCSDEEVTCSRVPDAQAAADGCSALPHTGQSVTGGYRGGFRAGAVVADPQVQGVVAIVELDVDSGAGSVAPSVR